MNIKRGIFVWLYALFLVSFCFTEEGYSSSFSKKAMYYKHDIEKIVFTIPKEKAAEGTAKLQFLDKNNSDTVAYEMPIEIKKGKVKYTIKKLPTGRIIGISKEMFEKYLDEEYLWRLHLKIIFPDGTEHTYNDNQIVVGAMFHDKNSEWDGDFNYEVRGETTIDEKDFSFVLPYGYKEFTVLNNSFIYEQKTPAKVYSSVDYTYWNGFSVKEPELFSIGALSMDEFIFACEEEIEPQADTRSAFSEYIKEMSKVKKVSTEAFSEKNNFASLKISAKCGRVIREYYIYYSEAKIIYVDVRKKKKNSEIEKIVPRVIQSLVIK